MPVERMDFPYRIAGRKAPDRPPVLLGAVPEAAAAGWSIGPGWRPTVWRSAAGRWAGACARWPWPTGCPPPRSSSISYPLHPPGKPDDLRTAHLPSLTVPCLFVQGTRDPVRLARGAERGDGDHPRAR